ncbi:PEP-CTERM/exosortase system-associated acyltransferase [Neptunomonas japonica]|uniref:PEP-CTERM/exosortase system-associated acyltransferase n=1 Tax=Neptunomonas japonica TaxID=417574 RepID=UPI000419E647|nr:PEP-CTERM/exosortase system-associated acyltransferase [Neptunomonas japonica]
MKGTLANNFQEYFTVNLAFNDELKKQSFRTRFNVYCKEFNYEAAENFPNEEESDEFDLRSLHCLIKHKASGKTAGCVRLVPTNFNESQSLLPFEKHCGANLDAEFIEKLNLDRNKICEISRLAVDGTFRRRTNETTDRFGNAQQFQFTDEERRHFPLIAVSAFLAATSLTTLSERTNVFAMMEPFLPRLLKRSGIIFQKAGEDIDYHGTRAPYFIRTESAIENMKPELKELYDAIHNSISKDYTPNM